MGRFCVTRNLLRIPFCRCGSAVCRLCGANPDYRAFEKPKDGGEPQPVVRQGTIAEMYRRMDGRVVEFGKPHANIYQYAFRKLGISPSGRVAMIGDTFRTDMAGALNAGISAVLVRGNRHEPL